MANTITKQTLSDGDRNLVVKITIEGDGTGDETDVELIDISTYTSSSTDKPIDNVSVNRISGNLTGFSIKLSWDATSNVMLASFDTSEFDSDYFSDFGGLVNPKASGYTGDILFTTTGLGAGDNGFLILEMVKKYA